MSDQNALYSTSVKAGKTTYFVDVKEAKNGNKYLSITESKLHDGEKQRRTLNVFDENVEQFRQAINEAADALAQS
jgi:hypothetical protein